MTLEQTMAPSIAETSGGRVIIEQLMEQRLRVLSGEQQDRRFFALDKSAELGPTRYTERSTGRTIDVWCTNDYLGQSLSGTVIGAARDVITACGVGTGSVRSISGTTSLHFDLERAIAEFHGKQAALVFNSGFICNESCLYVLGKCIPGLVILSDEKNHASMALGIINSRAEKVIFRHNDVDDLEAALKRLPRERPKLIVFESVYSMDGTVSPIEKVVALAKRYNALTYLDEVHAVGMYGPTGAGISQELGVQDEIDIVQGTFGKALGTIGGYVATTSLIREFLIQHAPGFIFSTSMPACIIAASLQSLREIASAVELRKAHRANVQKVRTLLDSDGHVVMSKASHIIPVFVGSAALATRATMTLLERHRIFVQAIKPPSVKQGEERLRITPLPQHSDAQIGRLRDALAELRRELPPLARHETTLEGAGL
jgi:5-aminolevulinate synthase